MSSPSIFPVELYNAIIDVSDFDMLGTYRLVCQAWLRSSQYRYFRQVRIDDSNIQAFVDSLSSPMCRIAPLIHKLEILFQFDPSNLGEYPDAGRLNGLANLPIFVSLTSLRLRAMKWAHISVDIQAVFRPFREVVELEIDDVYFDDVSQLVEMFCAFPSLQSLTLQGGVGYRDTDVMTPSLRRANVLTRLKTIKITNSWCPEILTLISLCLPKPALETLHLSTLFLPSMPFFGEFVTPSAPFLKEVKFLTTNFGHDAEAILGVFGTMSSPPFLSTISFNLQMFTVVTSHYTFLPSCARLSFLSTSSDMTARLPSAY